MKLAVKRAGTLAVLAMLQSCGGGGGSDNNGGGNPPPPGAARLDVTPNNVSASATPGQASPTGEVRITIKNPPADGVYLFGQSTNTGLDAVEFDQINSTSGALIFRFRSPNVLRNDTYTDTFTLRACLDEACNSEIQGSPETIHTSYKVYGTGVATATLDRSLIEVAAGTDEQNYRTEYARITLSAPASQPIHIERTYTENALQQVNWLGMSEQITDLVVEFLSTDRLGPGKFSDTINLRLCYDPSCIREVTGSPMVVQTALNVSAQPEPGVPPLEYSSRIALSHDVVDAEFDAASNKIVMVSNVPANALYVYDVASGTEASQSLSSATTSVSVSPDGATAAVGHDGQISVVDLATVGQPGAPAPELLPVSADVFDLVLDGHGRVHAVQELQIWTKIHSVDLATGVDTLSSGLQINGGSVMRLHPSGDYLFSADEGISPDDVHRWDIRSGSAAYMHDSPHHGYYAMCSNLWFGDAGNRIYTACGNTFQLSDNPAQDMLYLGALSLTTTDFTPFQIRALSLAPSRNELALIEYDWDACTIRGYPRSCYTHLAYHEADFLRRQAVYSLAPITIDDISYLQLGLFVFHDASNARKYVISRLKDAPDPASEYYLTVVE